MKVVVSLILVVALICPVAPFASAEPRQVVQGTELHLTLLTAHQQLNSKGRRSHYCRYFRTRADWRADTATCWHTAPWHHRHGPESKVFLPVQGSGLCERHFQGPGSG